MGRHLIHVRPLSEPWFDIRRRKGNITASFAGNCVGINAEDYELRNIKDPVARGKKQIQNAFSLVRDPSSNTFKGNWFTRRGNFYEPTCFKVFEAAMGIKVNESNIWQSEEYDFLYATPDGLIDDETGLEVKNPWAHMHREPPPHYIAQMQIQMHCSNRKKTYFMSQCLKENCARIWMVYFSQTYFNWLMDQLQYFHQAACDPDAELDLSRFDFKPPFVAFELLKEITSITDLIGEIPEFPEPEPEWMRAFGQRKRKFEGSKGVTTNASTWKKDGQTEENGNNIRRKLIEQGDCTFD